MAIALWFFVLSSSGIEVSKEIKLVLDTAPNLMVSNDVTNKITVRLSGSKFFLRTITNSLDVLRLDLTDAKEGPTYYNISSDILRLPIGVKVLSISPSRIYPMIESVKYKTVPVEVNTTNTLPSDLRLLKLLPSPSKVRIRGPRSRIEKIKVLRPEPVDISNVDPSFRWEVPIKISIPGVSFDEEVSPKIIIEVEPKGSKFRIAGVPLQVLADGEYTISIKKVALYVRGSKKVINAIKSKEILAEVDVRGLSAGEHLRQVKVKLPRGIKLVRVVPSQVKITLE